MLNLKRLLAASAFAVALAFALPALAIGVTNPAPVQMDPTRLDADSVCTQAPAINQTAASTTCTITPPVGQFVYVDTLIFEACGDGTASVSSIQQNFTSTNFGGLAWETSMTSYAATTATSAFVNNCAVSPNLAAAAPLKSAVAGTAVTFVPPAQAAHMSFGMFVGYHFAPY